jgi:2-polyprenyl-3-methyl-5-hydroxy-6-metoxy-1,4-benzoquinol methylase
LKQLSHGTKEEQPLIRKLGVTGSTQVEQAIVDMLDQYRCNAWMINEHWPLNEPHVRLMMTDILAQFPPGRDTRLLDVGCFNGYISLLFRQLGYQVTGTDASEHDDRSALFDKFGIEFVPSNMNELNPFGGLAKEPFDVVIIAQVIEHILNHPLGLIRSLANTMRPGGLMVLTTPNPATVMCAARSLRGRSLLWGTHDFIDEPKISGNEIITKADIHYREYTLAELHHLLLGAGLQVELARYVPLGITRMQSPLKRMVKRNPITQKLMTKRLFASNHYLLARKL